MPDFFNILDFGSLGVPKLLVKDEILNDSDKVFTVPAGKTWKILWIFVDFATTATAGARRMQLEFRDDADVPIFASVALNTQVASASEKYKYEPGIAEPGEVVATAHNIPIPIESFLPAGFDIRIFDKQAIAPAGDDMKVYIMGQEYPS